MYTWIEDNELKSYLVLSDKSLNEVYQEVRQIFPQVYVNEKHFTSSNWLGKKKSKTEYVVYVRTTMDDNEVRIMNMSFTNRELVVNFLYGLLNGHHWTINGKKTKKKK